MRRRFMSGVIAGSILGATAGMYATSKMSPRQRKKMMKRSKKILMNMMDNVDLF